MTVRAVEWKKPYTWGTAITVDENKVISLNLRDENNLIIYDSWDDEIYVDLQLPDEITPTDAFPVWVTTGRVIVDNGWDAQGTIICAKTTSGDNIKILYEDNWTLWMDNGTWTFKQIYFKSDVDGIITTLTTYINWELAKKQNWVTSDTAPSNPSEWDLWYDTVNDALKVYDGTNWVATGTGWSWDVVVSTDTGNELSTGVGLWLGTETDFSSISTPDTNTLYIQYKSDWGGGWQPWVNTIAYYPLDSVNTVNDLSWNNHNWTQSWTITFWTALWVDCASFNQSGYITVPYDASLNTSTITISFWCAVSNAWTWGNINWWILCRSNLSGHWVYGVANVWAEGKNFAVQLDWWSFDQREVMFTSSNQWEYITVTYNWTTGNIYKNWSLVDTFSYTCDISQSTENLIMGTYYDSSFKFSGKLSNIIIEDQVRDATAISNYYDLTKWDYWIS